MDLNVIKLIIVGTQPITMFPNMDWSRMNSIKC